MRSDGERLFAAYLRQRRLEWEYEPDLAGRHPDFLVQHPLGLVVCEVYEPEIRLPRAGAGVIDSYGPLRNAFESRKRKQINAARAAGHPYVAVVGETNTDVGIDPVIMAGAMFGAVGVTFPINTQTGGPDGEPDSKTVFLAGGRLQEKRRTGVSAVAVPKRFNPTEWRVQQAYRDRLRQIGLGFKRRLGPRERRLAHDIIRSSYSDLEAAGTYDPHARQARLVVLHNPHAAIPLEPGVFGGPHDDQWSTIEADDRLLYTVVCRGRLCWEIPSHEDH